MKTERMTLLVSPADKAAIAARAASLGMSVSELVRTAALEYAPDEAEIRAEIEALLPEVSAAITRMEATFDRMIASGEEHRRKMEWLRSDEGRAEVQQQVWADPRIDWDRIAALKAGVLHNRVDAA